jgi:hypothetical protein
MDKVYSKMGLLGPYTHVRYKKRKGVLVCVIDLPMTTVWDAINQCLFDEPSWFICESLPNKLYRITFKNDQTILNKMRKIVQDARDYDTGHSIGSILVTY